MPNGDSRTVAVVRMHLGFEPDRCGLPIGGEIEIGGPDEALLQNVAVENTRHAIGAHAAIDVSCEIPAAAFQHETERRDATAFLGPPALVADFDQVFAQQRAGNGAQMLRLLGFAEPAWGIEMKAFLHPAGVRAQIGRQCRHQLGLRRQHRSIEAKRGCRPRQSRHEQRLGLRLRQSVQPHAIAVEQAIAAFRAAIGIDGNAGRGERIDVAIDGAHRNLAGVREFRRGDLSPRLQGGEDRKQPARAHGPLNHT